MLSNGQNEPNETAPSLPMLPPPIPMQALPIIGQPPPEPTVQLEAESTATPCIRAPRKRAKRFDKQSFQRRGTFVDRNNANCSTAQFYHSGSCRE